MDLVSLIFNPAVVWVLIPLTVLIGAAVQKIAKVYFAHQERMALIDQGIHPDDPSIQNADRNR